MRAILNIGGAILVLVGTIWFLQGINVLPGSFMTGQTKWAVYGGCTIAAGVALVFAANRRNLTAGANLRLRVIPDCLIAHPEWA